MLAVSNPVQSAQILRNGFDKLSATGNVGEVTSLGWPRQTLQRQPLDFKENELQDPISSWEMKGATRGIELLAPKKQAHFAFFNFTVVLCVKFLELDFPHDWKPVRFGLPLANSR